MSGSFSRLPESYTVLFEALRYACLGDDRVRAMWLGGAMARGDEDRSSDLDVLLAVSDDAFDAFAAGWQQWLAGITPTVIARQLPFAPGCLYCVTPTMERLDIISEPVRALTGTFHRVRRIVFDKDGWDASIPAAPPASGPSPSIIAGHIEEFLRSYAMFHVFVDREDWLLGLEAIHILRTLLYRLFVESNAPVPLTGVKHWSDKLTGAQRAVLQALPAARARRDEVIAAHEAVALAFRSAALEIAERFGVEWPVELERSVCRSLADHGLPHLAGAD